jgi:hypothetical protein
MPTYKGSKYINRTLTTKGFDEQIRKLEGFDTLFNEIMPPAMQKAVDLARAHAVENAPRGETGGLAASIQGRMLTPTKNSIRGAINAGAGQPELKAFSQEVGRFYGTRASGSTYYWKGRFYLYYGASERKEEINKIFGIANQYLISRLVVK